MSTMTPDPMATLRAAQPEIHRRFGVHSFFVFGSVARREAGPGSDVDVLVEFDRPVGLFEFGELRERLAEILGRPVDLATEESPHPRMRAAALAEAIRVA